jgi:hypothetical protein
MRKVVSIEIEVVEIVEIQFLIFNLRSVRALSLRVAVMSHQVGPFTKIIKKGVIVTPLQQMSKILH